MKNILRLSQPEKKELLRQLLGAQPGEAVPRGVSIPLADFVEKDVSTVSRWLKDGDSWPSAKVERKVWGYFGLTGLETPAEAISRAQHIDLPGQAPLQEAREALLRLRAELDHVIALIKADAEK